jgi:Beta protein
MSEALSAVKSGGFRSLIFSASGIPRKSKRTTDGTPLRLPNYEYATWSELLKNRAWNSLRFSDYGARYAHQTEGGGGAAPPARIHLVTESEHILYFDKSGFYRELAKGSLKDPAFSRQGDFRGKASVRAAAQGSGGIGRATDWVARDTSMHIETIAEVVAVRLQELGMLEHFNTAEIASEPETQVELQLSEPPE